jgi:sugar phosphate isomerase/epimerase
MRLRYAISLWNFSHYARVGSLEQALGRMRAMGYGVELWDHWPGMESLYAPSQRARVKAALAGMPVSLHTALVYSPEVHLAQVDAAHDLGARVLVVHSDEFFAGERGVLDVALCREVVAYAAERGVCIALENGQLPFLERAIAAVDGLKICLDVGHVYLTDVPMRDFLAALKSQIVHLHLQDVLSPAEIDVPHAGADHYALGTGGIPREDWELLAATLQAIDFDGTAVLEIQPRTPYQIALLGTRFFDGLLPQGTSAKAAAGA